MGMKIRDKQKSSARQSTDLFTLFAVSRVHLFHVGHILLQTPDDVSRALLRLPKRKRHDWRQVNPSPKSVGEIKHWIKSR